MNKQTDFQIWFEEVEINGQMRCDNIYDEIEKGHKWELSDTYDFVEKMMLVAYCAGAADAKAELSK